MTSTSPLAPIDAFLVHDDPVNHVAFGAGGSLIATADTAMRVKVWQNRELRHTYDLRSISDKVRPTERIRAVRFAPGDATLFIAAGEGLAGFNLSSDSPEPEWRHVAPRLFAFLIVSPTSLAISERGTLAAAFDNGSIAMWDAAGSSLGIIKHNAAPRYLAFLPDETLVGVDGFSISLWRQGERRPIWQRKSDHRIYGMAASSDGRYIALRHLYTTTVHEVSTGQLVIEHRQGRGLPLLAFEPGSHVLAVGTQHAIDLYDVSANTHARLGLDDAELISLKFLPDGSQAIAGCSDGRIRTWENPLWESKPLDMGSS